MNKQLKFIVGSAGIYYCYLQLGLLQERIFKYNYGTIEQPSPKFTYAFSLILFQMVVLNLVSQIFLFFNRTRFVCTKKQSLYLGLFNFISLFGANTALQYVSYPLQALTKSCKILSVLIVGLCIGKQRFSKEQVSCGVLITAGILLFNLNEAGSSQKANSLFGVGLLLVSLFSDGMLATLQSQYKQQRHIGQWEMTFHVSLWGVIASTISAFLLGNFHEFVQYVLEYPDCLYDLGHLTILGVVGQLCIFFIINEFSPRSLAVVTTSRKFFAVICSLVYNGHPIAFVQIGALILVAGGISWELFMGFTKKIPAESSNHHMPKSYYVKKYQNKQEEDGLVQNQSC